MTRSAIEHILPATQILISILLVVAIILQPSTAGVGGSLGGSDSMQNFRTKRGFEKFLFIATIVLSIVFAGLCVLAIVL